jgi:hypothetical protein
LVSWYFLAMVGQMVSRSVGGLVSWYFIAMVGQLVVLCNGWSVGSWSVGGWSVGGLVSSCGIVISFSFEEFSF